MKHILIFLAFLMTIGTQVSAKGVKREASIDILSKGQILVTRINEDGWGEYHVIYRGEFYWCKSNWFINGAQSWVRCVDGESKDE